MSMTRNERRQTAVPYQDIRILNSLAWFSSPRRFKKKKQSRREKTLSGRIRHGIARAIEDLRGVRLPLVSGPESGERVLQRL
jgi:hypothetical protein